MTAVDPEAEWADYCRRRASYEALVLLTRVADADDLLTGLSDGYCWLHADSRDPYATATVLAELLLTRLRRSEELADRLDARAGEAGERALDALVRAADAGHPEAERLLGEHVGRAADQLAT